MVYYSIAENVYFDHTSTDLLFSMSTSDVCSAIEEVTSDWEVLGVSLGIPTSKLRTIDANFHKVEEKKIELIQTWMTGKNMPNWSLLVKALLSPMMNQPIIAENISQQQSKSQASNSLKFILAIYFRIILCTI